MERKHQKTHHPEPQPDVISICSSNSETICSDSSETLSNWSQPSRSSFLCLPCEIRFMIYQYAFSSPSNPEELTRVTAERGHLIHRSRFHFSKPASTPGKLRYTRNPTQHLPVALLRTNHQIYREALPTLYSGVVFGFGSNPTALTFLLDRFSETARNNVRYLHLYPAPLYATDGPLGIQLSWAVLCAQIAHLPFLRLISVVYHRVEDLEQNSIESQRSQYGKLLSSISAEKELEFEAQCPSMLELDLCRSRFTDIVAFPPA
ncbi:hypothetical protein BJX99DRAFT_252603 [Aspergillus californicus]